MSHNDEAEDKKTVNVVDRRRFDAAGDSRSEETSTTAGSTKPDPDFKLAPDFKLEGGEVPEEVAFSSFVMSLATQVLVQIGEMPAPGGMEIPIDMVAARQTIDIIAMLQKRTRGNLSTEEARFLEEVLHSLRMSFVARSKKH